MMPTAAIEKPDSESWGLVSSVQTMSNMPNISKNCFISLKFYFFEKYAQIAAAAL